MAKSRTRTKADKKKKVYTHQRERKQVVNKTKLCDLSSFKQLNGVIQHSIEIAKLKIEINGAKKQIAMFARNRDNMSLFISMENEIIEYLTNKIEEHINACIVKMNLFLGENAEQLIIPKDFHLGSTDLKNGYVSLESKETKIDADGNKYHDLMSVILSAQPANFPNDLVTIGTIMLHDDDKLKALRIEPLLKNEDTISNILLQKVSMLESKTIRFI